MSKNSLQSEPEYMLLFRGTGWHKGLSSETVQTVMNQWYDWFEQLVEQGRATSGHPLAYEGKIVSGKKGHTVIDGPFVESKEAIGGYFLLHVENEKEAIEIAKHCPGLEYGVEVTRRGILPFGRACQSAGRAAEGLSKAESISPKWASWLGLKRPPTCRGRLAQAPLQISRLSYARRIPARLGQ